MTNLFLMMKALVVIFERQRAFLLARVVFGRCVDDVTAHHLLPEGEATANA